MISRVSTSTDRRWRALLPVAVVLAVMAFGLTSSGYVVTVIGFAAIYGIFCTGLNFFMGYTGQASFGQNAFAALGGYGTAILCGNHYWDPLAAFLVSMVFAGLVAYLVGLPTLKLRGHYLAMATFALGLITYEISIEWNSLTQGYMGISGIPPLGVWKFELANEKQMLVALTLLMLLGVWISVRLRDSRFGRALRAIAGSEPAARALGIDVARYKLAAFVIAALYASAAGSLFAHFVGFISPEVFGAAMVIQSFTMLFLGGIGTTWGPIVGAIMVLMLPEFLRGLKELQDVVYSMALIALLIFAPKGLAGLGSLFARRPKAALPTPSGAPARAIAK
ncbi:branched-chain amino acid ABC transporter permease [Prosthecodimorpha staleyi]|uniref:Branched-chain amino acid ABC transporter permease n=1 Tax=Prosthecodimorpha staleyi TaxID=2840188 RepID=A0A947GH06_9HYPH|nr:branched-chain amino acid ABC transporter permease [Prosthecodimorpha staleyi]MBT9293135.1 branched-chain amino acid ABC transporter permease [Prosthecodimorpha staleyi]